MANYNGKKKVRVTAGSIKNSGSTWRDTEDKGKHTEKVRVTAGNIRNAGSVWRPYTSRRTPAAQNSAPWEKVTQYAPGPAESIAPFLQLDPEEKLAAGWAGGRKGGVSAWEQPFAAGAVPDQTKILSEMTAKAAEGEKAKDWADYTNQLGTGNDTQAKSTKSVDAATQPGLYEKWYIVDQSYKAFNDQIDAQLAEQEKSLKPGYVINRPTQEERDKWFREMMKENGMGSYLVTGMPDQSDEGYRDYVKKIAELEADYARLDEYDKVAAQEQVQRENKQPEWWEYFVLPAHTAYKYWKNGQPEDAYTRAQSYIRQDQTVNDLEGRIEALDMQIKAAPEGNKQKLEEEKDELTRQLDARRVQLTQYAQERIAGEYEQIAQDADFAELAAAGAAKGGKLKAVKKNPVGSAFLSADAPLYGAMTQEEQDVYHAHLARGGEQEANAYFESIRERLSGRTAAFGEDMLEKIGSDEAFERAGLPEFMKPVRQSIVQTAKGATSFLAGGTEAVQGLGQTARMAFLGEEAPLPQSYLQKAQQLFREDMDGVEAVVNDILYGIGEMLPAVAVGIATGGAGVPAAVGSAVSSLMTAGTSFGSTYSQARREGKEAGEAASYALLTAASEAALQYGFSGVKALGGSALSRTLGKKLDGVLGKLASGNLGQRFAGMVLKNIGQNGGEFVEEYLQSVMTPFLRNAAFGENNEVSFLSEDALYDGMVGYLTSMVMNVPYVAGRRGAGDGEAALAISDAQRILQSGEETLTPQERALQSGLLEAVETGRIGPEVREALPLSANERIAAAQVRIWAENGRLNETIGLEQDIGTLAPQEQALCREVQEAVESGRVTAELKEKLGLPGNERVAVGLLRTWAQDGTIARLIGDVQAG